MELLANYCREQQERGHMETEIKVLFDESPSLLQRNSLYLLAK